MARFPEFRDRLKEAMAGLGFQQANGRPDVARFYRESRIGVSLKTVYAWVKGESQPERQENIDALATALGMNAFELMHGKGPVYLPGHVPQLAPSTQVTRRSTLRVLCRVLGDLPLSDLTPRALDGYAAARLGSVLIWVII